MSTSADETTTTAEAEGTQAEHGETVIDRGPTEHEHPSDFVYLKIAIILGVITAAEIALYFLEDELSSTVVVPSLLAMMVAKFLIVVGYFMHLKYDDPIFSRVFYAGLILAVAVFGITFTVFEFWTDDFFRFLR